MSRKLGNKINEGISAEIFKWENNEKIIKLAKSKNDHQAIQTEYFNSRFAWNNGLSVPQPLELKEVNGRLGIVFERIYGNTLMERFQNQYIWPSNTKKNIKNQNYEDIARISAKILSETHRKSNTDISWQRNANKYYANQGKYPPSQRDAIINSIHQTNYLSISEKKLVFDVLNSIPIKQQLCHGDPNLNNILIRDRDNKTVLIDWMYASIGNPEADLAEYIIMIKYSIFQSNIPSGFADYNESIREEIIKVFIEEYTKLSDITYKDIAPWIIPMSAQRLSACIIKKAEKKLLIGEIRKRLEKYKRI